MCKETVLRENIQRHLRDNVALFDCQGGCPDEVAIYEQEHYGETIRTAEYCNECFANQIIALIEETSYKAGVEDGEVTAYHNAYKAGKKEGVWAVTEYLDVYDDDGYCRICNHLNYADWQEFLKGLEG